MKRFRDKKELACSRKKREVNVTGMQRAKAGVVRKEAGADNRECHYTA